MTDSELSFAIVEMIEPKPTLTGREAYDDDCADISDKRFWMLKSRPEWHWQPRDMVNDPATTLMLLERLADRECGIEVWAGRGGWWLGHSSEPYETLANTDDCGKLGRAVAEAWYRSQGGRP